MSIKFEIQGQRELKKDMMRFMDKFPEQTSLAIYQEASDIMNLSKYLCPFRFGYLRNSGRVERPIANTGRIDLLMGYYTDYALYVHENLMARHTFPTMAKFLDAPILQRLPTLLENIMERTRLINELEGRN